MYGVTILTNIARSDTLVSGANMAVLEEPIKEGLELKNYINLETLRWVPI